jgi:hypothetical protein
MRTFLAIAVLSSVLALGGWTYSLASASQPPIGHDGSSLCGDVGRVTSLEVHRVAINAERFVFPAWFRVTSASLAQAVAQELCSLPKAPTGVFYCPDAYGPTYHLTFFDKGSPISIDLASPTGCASVVEGSNTGTPLTLAPTGTFWKTLGAALGVPDASQLTFAGSLI